MPTILPALTQRGDTNIGALQAYVVELMKDRGVLLSTDGPHHNVLKIKPPLVWTEAEVDELLSGLDAVLAHPALAR